MQQNMWVKLILMAKSRLYETFMNDVTMTDQLKVITAPTIGNMW